MRHRPSATHRRFFCSIPTFSGSVLLSALALAGSAQGAEPSAQADYRIGSESLDRALVEFSQASGIQVVADGKLTSGMSSSGASGRYTPEQALQKLLQGTGITYRFSGKGTVTLEKQQPAAAPDNGATLGKVTVTAKNENDPYSKEYSRPMASTATKTSAPIMETPLSIQVLPKAVMEDQQATRIEDAVKNVSGVQSGFNYGDQGYDFYIRGFNTSFNVFRNGFRAGNISGAPGIANVEQIEVLKGPASVMYGRLEPGGMINLVTKKPLFSPYYSLQQQFGSYDFYRTTLDATGPVTGDESLAYRFNFEYLDKDSFRDWVSMDRAFVAPSVTWKPREDTELNLTLEYARVNSGQDQGVPAVGNRPAPIPASRNLGGTNNHQTTDNLQLFLTGTHQINKDWSVRGGFSDYWNSYSLNYFYQANMQPDNRTMSIYPIRGINDENRWGMYLDTTGKFNTFGLDHELLVGADYYNLTKDYTVYRNNFINQDIYTPTYYNFDFASLDTAVPRYPLGTQEWAGLYFQDQITLWENVHILGGGRYDWANTASGFSRISLADARDHFSDRTDERFSPRVGILYRPWTWLSLYGNFIESLGANNFGVTSSGSLLTPQTSTQFEGGVKTEFFNGRLSASLAYFHLTKENLPTADLSTPDPYDKMTIGQARSKGIEFDIKGQITEQFSLIGSYAYMDANITKDVVQTAAGTASPGNTGNMLPNAPRNSGSLWAKYSPIPDKLDFGTGVYAAGQRQGDYANTFQLPGYVRWDAYAAYHWKIGPTKMTAQVNVNNILNKQYYLATNQFDGDPRAAIIPAEPLSVFGSIRLQY